MSACAYQRYPSYLRIGIDVVLADFGVGVKVALVTTKDKEVAGHDIVGGTVVVVDTAAIGTATGNPVVLVNGVVKRNK